MKRRFRCRLGLHKWILKQESSDAPRYYGCRYCEETMGHRTLIGGE